MKEKFNEKVIPIILKFINTKGIQSIKNGMVTSMSPLIIGSIFLILSNFPVKAVVDVLESTGIKAVLDQAYMLLMHAEDQLMSAEGFRILADEFIALYKRIDEK